MCRLLPNNTPFLAAAVIVSSCSCSLSSIIKASSSSRTITLWSVDMPSGNPPGSEVFRTLSSNVTSRTLVGVECAEGGTKNLLGLGVGLRVVGTHQVVLPVLEGDGRGEEALLVDGAKGLVVLGEGVAVVGTHQVVLVDVDPEGRGDVPCAGRVRARKQRAFNLTV
jgi:hypothetical protein